MGESARGIILQKNTAVNIYWLYPRFYRAIVKQSLAKKVDDEWFSNKIKRTIIVDIHKENHYHFHQFKWSVFVFVFILFVL